MTTENVSNEIVEYAVWYDAFDGPRRHMLANDKQGIQQIISDLQHDEIKRRTLAASVGIAADTHDFKFEILQNTVTTQKVQL